MSTTPHSSLRVLVTGAAGYLGSITLRRLLVDLRAGAISALWATDLRPLPAEQATALEGVQFMAADLRKMDTLRAVFESARPDVVIHLAAVLDSASLPAEVQYDIDVEGTRRILELCREFGTRRILISSSGAAYGYHADNPAWLEESDPLRGNDIFLYSKHKRIIEELLAEYRKTTPKLEQIIFRVGTILGDKTENLITQLFMRKRILGLRGYESPFTFIWDEDAAEGFRLGVHSQTTGIFNLTASGALRNRDMARLMGKTYLNLPAGLLRAFLSVGFALGISRYNASQLLYLQFRPVLDNYHLRHDFGFTPSKTSLEVFCDFLRARGIEPKDAGGIVPLMPPAV